MAKVVQKDVIGFLSRPESHPGPVERVDVVETHISVIFLAGDRVYKMKRPVRYPYLDFSTLALRKRYCEAEVAVNSRTAPGLYKGCVPVCADPSGRLRLGGGGEAVEWLVEMARFDEDGLFDRLATAGRLKRSLMEELAEAVAAFHEAAESRPDVDSRQGMIDTVAGVADSFAEFGAGIFDPRDVERLIARQMAAARGPCGEKAAGRREARRVRHCHGDLHLRNICLIEGRPTLFDAIEFNDSFSDIDVFYDLAFLLMDLDHRGLRRLANIVLNRYLDVTGDTDGLGCLGLFLSVRAAIRAHVCAAASARHSDPRESGRVAAEARTYFDLARDYLSPPEPRLIAVGGLSGSGKSRMSRELAPHVDAAPGARVVRSDVVRKRLAGVDPLTPLPPESYTPETARRTYEAVYAEVRRTLAEGQSVIADAVFARPEERAAIADVAREMSVPFDGLWLLAPGEVLQGRVEGRSLNASDADAGVVRKQLSYDLGDIRWTPVDSSGDRSSTLEKGLKTLGLS